MVERNHHQPAKDNDYASAVPPLAQEQTNNPREKHRQQDQQVRQEIRLLYILFFHSLLISLSALGLWSSIISVAAS